MARKEMDSVCRNQQGCGDDLVQKIVPKHFSYFCSILVEFSSNNNH